MTRRALRSPQAWLTSIALLCVVAAPGAAANADDFPGSRPIRFIVPFPPGGGTDILSRVITDKLRETVHWSFVVENKPGAGGNIGADAIAKAAPDGYTIGLGQSSNLAINPTLHGKLPYDPLADLQPVIMVADVPLVLVVSAASEFRTLADLIAAGKAKPGTLNFATPGNGTASHLSGELLQLVSGAKFQHIPYKGATQALTDIVGNRADLMMASATSVASFVKSGRLRVLAVTSAQRAAAMPEAATVAEQGFTGFSATSWYGVIAPRGVGKAIIEHLNSEIGRTLTLPDVREKIAADGGAPVGGTPEHFAGIMAADHAKWGKVLREAGVKLQ